MRKKAHLLFLLLLLALSSTYITRITNAQLTTAERRQRRKLIEEQRERAWAAEYQSAPKRERKWKCFAEREDEKKDSFFFTLSSEIGAADGKVTSTRVKISSSNTPTTPTPAGAGRRTQKKTQKSNIINEKQQKQKQEEDDDDGTEEEEDAKRRCGWEGLQVALAEGEGLQACVDCTDAQLEGLYVDTWQCKYRPKNGYRVDAEAVWAVPNDASIPLMNIVGGAAVIALRGNATFAKKTKHAQQAGAAALIIIDDGSCGETFTCGGWLGSRDVNGDMAAKDEPSAWEGTRIPVVLISASQGARLIRLLNSQDITIEGLGTQKYTP